MTLSKTCSDLGLLSENDSATCRYRMSSCTLQYVEEQNKKTRKPERYPTYAATNHISPDTRYSVFD